MPTERASANENYERFSYARDNGHLDFIAKAIKCDDYFVGQQWDPAHVRRLERLGKPVITVNKVLSSCATVFGAQLSNRSDISFQPGRGGNGETASALDKVWLHVANTNNLDWLESEVAADGFIRSRGFFDVRINFDDHLMGEVRINQLNSKSVVIDPDAEEYDPDVWKEVFVTKWLTAMDIERLYGRRYAKEVRQRPQAAFTHSYDTVDWLPDSFGVEERKYAHSSDDESRRMYRIIERQYRDLKWVECFANPETGDLREIPDTWSRERIHAVSQEYGLTFYRKRVEQIRWETSLDDIMLHKAWSPYKHFTPVPYFPYFRHGTTVGIVENILSPQDLLNKSISQELHIVNTTANSGWKVKVGSLANMTPEELEERGGEDGLVIQVNGSPNDVDKIQPNQVPTGIDRLSFKADEALKEVSMVSDSMRGFDRADVAAKAIQAKQASGSVSLAKPFDNLAYTRKLVARNTLSLIQSFYTEQRLLNITGRNLADKSEELVINEPTPEGTIANDLTIGEYSVIVNTVPARESFEQSQFAEALELRREGIAIPDDVLIESSHLSRKAEISERIKSANGEGEPSQTQQQLQQMDLELKQLEAEEKKANVAVKQSNAQLNSARAAEVGTEQQGPKEGELMQLAMDREKMLTEIQLDKEKAEADIELKWAQFEEEQKLKRAELAGDLRIADQKAETDRAIAASKAVQTKKED